MYGGRSRRVVGALVGAGLLGALGAAPAYHPTAAQAQDQCVPPGAPVAAVPWSQRLLNPERAWPLATGAGQRVAVISTGVAETPHLTGVVAAATDLAPVPEFGEPSGATDCLGIGTGVAGVIAGQRVEGVGFRGVAPDAEILAAKIVGDQFPTDREPRDSVAPGLLAQGVDWAVDQDATVIALPTITYEDSDALQTAVERALDAGVVVVASVGDAGPEEAREHVAYPAAYDGVVGVGALAADLTSAISRPGYVDLVAPGVEIVSAHPGDGLGVLSGTGFAAGYVAGSVALVRSYLPELSHTEIVHRLFATATPAPEGVGSPQYGYGIVNPYQAMLDQVVAGAPEAVAPHRPRELTAEELARQQAEADSNWLAVVLAGAGLAVALALCAVLAFGPGGRRRRWRAGLAPPPDSDEDDRPTPPMDLFADRKKKAR